MNFDGNFYLVVKRKSKYGNSLSGRLALRLPSLSAGEVAIKLEVAVPEVLFERPILRAAITVPTGATISKTINATVLDNVREVLQQQTGLDIRIALVEPETEIEE